MRQQLILASYHVCTQGYPDGFLRLSSSQRSHLQKTLRYLATHVQEELLAQLHVPGVLEATAIDPEATSNYLTDLLTPPTLEAAAEPSQPLSPAHLVQWQQALEQAIVAELHTASHAANRLLQQAGLLPKKLPEPVLEAAAKAGLAESSGNTPNILSLLVDATSEEASESNSIADHAVMRVVAIHLRLAELEFGDAASTAARARLRQLSAQLRTLGKDYQKKQLERSIAEAQSAWRSTWTED